MGQIKAITPKFKTKKLERIYLKLDTMYSVFSPSLKERNCRKTVQYISTFETRNQINRIKDQLEFNLPKKIKLNKNP